MCIKIRNQTNCSFDIKGYFEILEFKLSRVDCKCNEVDQKFKAHVQDKKG